MGKCSLIIDYTDATSEEVLPGIWVIHPKSKYAKVRWYEPASNESAVEHDES